MVKSVREASQGLDVVQRVFTQSLDVLFFLLFLTTEVRTLLAQTLLLCVCFPCEGVLLCRGDRLLTGSNSKKLKLWSVAAAQNFRPSNAETRSQDR